MDKFVEFLNSKFKKFGNKWLVHEFVFYGYAYGFEVIKKADGSFNLVTLEDSGYNKGTTIETDIKRIWRILDCFSPTNPNYKTD